MRVDYRLSIIDYRMVTTLFCNYLKSKIYSLYGEPKSFYCNLKLTIAYCPILKSIIYNLNSMRPKGAIYAS